MAQEPGELVTLANALLRAQEEAATQTLGLRLVAALAKKCPQVRLLR